jgi:DNA-damage-inducible protein J
MMMIFMQVTIAIALLGVTALVCSCGENTTELMANASHYVRARIDEKTKVRATAALDAMGLFFTDAIRMLMLRVAEEKRLPFNVNAPNAKTLTATNGSKKTSPVSQEIGGADKPPPS